MIDPIDELLEKQVCSESSLQRFGNGIIKL